MTWPNHPNSAALILDENRERGTSPRAGQKLHFGVFIQKKIVCIDYVYVYVHVQMNRRLTAVGTLSGLFYRRIASVLSSVPQQQQIQQKHDKENTDPE